MTDEAITSDAVEPSPAPAPAPAPAPELVDEQPDLSPETFDRAVRTGDKPADEPQAGELPAPLADTLEVPELAPSEHRFAEEVRQNLDQLAGVARAEGMSLGDTQGLVSLYYELDNTLGDLKVDQRDPDHQDRTKAILRQRWGSAYKDNLADAVKAFKSLSPATQQWLNETGAADDASVLTILSAMGGGLMKLSPAQAKAEADKMRTDSAALRNQSDPNYRAVLTKYRILRHLEGRGDGDQSERASEQRGRDAVRDRKNPPKADPKRMALETEARSIRESPEYYRGGPSARALSARLRQIYTELYPEDS